MEKYHLYLDETERRLIILCLNEFRNKLIAEGRHNEAVDDVLLIVVSVPIKKFKVGITKV